MKAFALAAFVLLGAVSFVSGAPSAGACGPTSIPNVPGCWGTPGCAYNIASDLGPGAACKFDYCDCGGTPVPLLPYTYSGTTTIGCASWTTQPSSRNCPTVAAVVPTTGSLSGSGAGGLSAPTSSLPTGATVVTVTNSGKTITETYAPTTYTQFATVTAVISTTVTDAQGNPTTLTVGPSGVAWVPYQQSSGAPSEPPPTDLPVASRGSSASSRVASGSQIAATSASNSSVSLPPGGTVVVGSVGSSAFTETFVPATLSGFLTLASTITTTTLNAQSSPVTLVIGPGGIEWTPLSLPSGIPEVPPPRVPPSNFHAPTVTPPSSTLLSSSSAPSTVPPTTSSPSASQGSSVDASQASITGAFDNTAQSETTIVVGGVTEHWSKATFPDLKTITAPRTITTPIVQTNSDGSKFTLTAAAIIIGPGGVWWNGGTGGWGIHGPSCIWPFCPPGGGGDVGGGGSGGSPNDPNTPNSPEKPSDPNQSQQTSNPTSSQQSTTTSSASSASSSSSSSGCSASTIASDCSVLCSAPTSATTQSCSTSCYSTLTACSVTGTTVTSTSSAAACVKPASWASVVDGDDSPDYEPLGTAGIATPFGGLASGPSLTGSSSVSASTGSGPIVRTTATATSSSGSSTIKPVSTSAAPTKIPGQGGVPGCAAIVSVPGTSAYCNCGGTPASTLSPTSSGFINCDYTIQPTSTYNPAISPSPPSAAPPVPMPEKCNIHVWQGLGQEYTSPEVVIDVKITDAGGTTIGSGSSKLNWAQTLDVDSTLRDVMLITPQTGVSKRSNGRSLGKRMVGAMPPRVLFESGPVQFAIGAQSWDTASSQCSVGGWDNGNAKNFFGALIFGDSYLPNRQMDCKFDCTIPKSKRSVEKQDERFHKSKRNDDPRHFLVTDPSKTVNTPSPVDEHLFDVRDLYSRVNHGEAWVKYAPSGAKYYKAWQDKTGDDAPLQCNFDDAFDVTLPVRFVSPARGIRPVLVDQDYGIGREYYAITATGPKNAADGPIADFSNTISATQGVFLANANNRGALPSDPADPLFNPLFPNGRKAIPWQFSSVAWAMWQKTVLTQFPEMAIDPSKADYSGIKSFWRREIDNPDTRAILEEAFKGKDIKSTQSWTPEDTNQDTNPFWALLGSPNGNGIQYFLTDNKVAVKGKGIKTISATTLQSSKMSYFTMWATFG